MRDVYVQGQDSTNEWWRKRRTYRRQVTHSLILAASDTNVTCVWRGVAAQYNTIQFSWTEKRSRIS